MKFTLPEQLPTEAAELDTLAAQARAEIGVFQARAAADDDLSTDDVERLQYLLDSLDTVTTASREIADAELSNAERLGGLLDRATTATAPAPEPETAVETPAVIEVATPEVVEDVAAEPVVVEPAESVAAAAKPVTFAGAGVTGDAPATETGPGWEMVPGAPGYRPGKIGFAEMGKAIDAVRGTSARVRPNRSDVRSMAARGLAQLSRQMNVVQDSHELVREIERATSEIPGHGKVTAQALTAAGGWCAPSEQLYDFCDVPAATDLISLPEIAINRGGIRWPVEPDLSAIFDSFEFFFTEPELQATDVDGNPTAVKHCVEVPCPDEFEELRLNAVGYCVNAGILQKQGWPESIEWFLRSLTQEHLRAMSRRTILDMVAGSESKVITGGQVNATSSVLNAIALMATNLRLNRGLGRNATIEGVAPSWLHEVLRADLAMMQGGNSFAVSDAQISDWLTARGIALQFVGDWQTRGAGEPGNLDTLAWPSTVQILLYPAGTWFRSMSNVIELGVLYPKEQLQLNRYTEFFTEDAVAVGKRCNRSLLVDIPICVSGGHGAPVEITCA
jgi:hypothetical protein